MPRLMSMSLTEDAIRAGTKTVTRRLGWHLDRNGRPLATVGDHLTFCRKVMGRRPGEPLVRIRDGQILDIARQPLHIQNTPNETELEGFPHLTWPEFVAFFCDAQRCTPDTVITRIEFRYLDQEPAHG